MNYYKTLNDEKKNAIKEKFLKSKDSQIFKKADKITKIALFGIIFSLFSFGFDWAYYAKAINFALDGFLFIISLVFFLKMQKVKSKEINKYALKNKEK